MFIIVARREHLLNLVENIFAMESRWIKNCLWLVLALFVLLIDQVTKTLAITYLQFGVANELMPGISLTLAHNTGAAFSLFNQGNGWQIIFFTVLAIIVSIYLTIWLIRSKKEESLVRISICLILGGTLGNMFDRIYYGYVIDFISVYYKSYYWPIFNIADSSISIGAGVMLYEVLGISWFKKSA